ncbi:efflux RND transporter periplasmic adaptor subunit [Saliterribacillus persicus]|uniref:RND family efflux transporter MFP subunit n=1 Tax=Saliterribacillus persicus TaxID=930114 RepID=A0A368YAX0_9BACI|nr:efflux RND transporter periplasmic adaptor subunit [Saliterribacillus persicus]RCW77411.1 RND family efflux transporter MFP subunit [Saliterribacillus persicus]
MKNLKWLVISMFVLFLVACSNESDEEETEVERVAPVEVAEVTEGDLEVTRTYLARTMPNQTTPVIPPVAGELEEIEVDNGEEVEEEDLLATVTSVENGREFEIEAQADGVISGLNAKEGGMVSNSDPLLTILDLDTITLDLQVTNEQLALFEDLEELNVSFEKTEDAKSYQATVENIANTAGETGLFSITLTLDNEEAGVRAGVVAHVAVPEKVYTDSLLVPTTSLVEENEQTFVYLVNEDETVSKVEITVEEMQSDITAITSEELAAGDQIVISGQLTLADESKISIIEEDQS